MNIIDDKQIRSLNIKSEDVLNWVEQAFISKKDSNLPHKISITFDEGTKFYNTMPTLMPNIDSAGVKIVSRYPERTPSIQGHILLYELSSGLPLAMLDATWITAQRTGAVAYLALKTFAKKDYQSVAVVGLGQTGLAFLDMLISDANNKNKQIKIMKYKGREIKVIEKLKNNGFNNILACDTYEELIRNSDVIVSAVTFAGEMFGEDEWYKKGVLVIPIHTRGFQNCDLFFDKVFADDTEHVNNFKYFSKFKYFNEFDKVLTNKIKGRESNDERILSYNIGIALHDIYIARMVYDKLRK